MLSLVLCRFDFTAEASHAPPLAREYRDPLAVLTAEHACEVAGTLASVDRALAAGRHVAGYVSYEAAAALDPSLATNSQRLQGLPLLQLGIYRRAHTRADLPAASAAVSGWHESQTAARHAAAIARIKDHIGAGDTYQVNHTLRLRSRLRGSPLALYGQLLSRQPAGWSAYIDASSHQLLSFSPELFFLKSGDRLMTRPMKGTTRRSTDPQEDALLRASLLASPKERAENLMITDLLRNDLGRLARPGTVQVERLFEVESLPTLHALTSTVTAQLAEEAGPATVFRALFPCGSVTGAPKMRTMEIIRSLEPEPRGVYCGSLGFMDPDGTWAFNVAIRTLQHDARSGELVYGTGGGITWDSDEQAEYREALLKASFLTAGDGPFRQKGFRPAADRAET